MSEENPRRAFTTLAAINPDDGKRWAVRITFDKMDLVAKRGMLHASELAHIVPAVLLSPTAILEGSRRDCDEDHGREGYGWLCYCGKPRCAYDDGGKEIPPWPNQVFLVFVNENRVVYNWRWEKADAGKASLPEGFRWRFRKQVL